MGNEIGNVWKVVNQRFEHPLVSALIVGLFVGLGMMLVEDVVTTVVSAPDVLVVVPMILGGATVALVVSYSLLKAGL
ncbi:hypothetical protein SAMN04488691_105153 [Haloferax larsenii]|uniref:Uncharacterized protein n=1 Tax=Haloferax larsenii TaxID=302484 RepID=A0A1H7QUM0_HALLR|nr:hypothetical protein SAMN04488691_105153 [Haloferax larsenii]